MTNFEPIGDPRGDFATFWTHENQSVQEREDELRRELARMAREATRGAALKRCGTIENEDEGGLRYYVVPSDLLEVALIALELEQQRRQNDRLYRVLQSEQE